MKTTYFTLFAWFFTNILFAQTFPNTGFTLPAGKQICITYEVMVNNDACPTGTVPGVNISNQSNVMGNFGMLDTDDPDISGASNPTLTPFSALTLGNLVYSDNNRNGVFDGGDVGIDGVTVNLYLDDGDGVLDVDDTFKGTTMTATVMAQAGTYSFVVCPGDYIVEVAASNFAMGGALYNSGAPLISSPVGGAADPDDNANNDDNGDPVVGFGVASAAVTMSYGAEPALVDDGDDTNGNLTVDFGFKTPATVTVTVLPTSVPEDGGTGLVYTFTRNDANPSPLVVNFSVGGTATFSTDYMYSDATTFSASSGTVTFTGSNTMATVTLTPTSDLTVEADETAILTITSATNYIVGIPAAATGTITNDDTDVTVAVLPSSVLEDGAPNLDYTFTRTGVIATPLTVNFSVGGTTTFPGDYTQSGATLFTPPTGTVTFLAGSATATVTLDPVTDMIVELDETAILTVTSGAGYNIGTPSVATGTITNDDTDVTVAVAPSDVLEDGVPNLVYTFTRTGVTTGTLTINFSVGGSATFNTDYIQTGAASFSATMGTATFGAGMSTVTVTINPTSDVDLESDETVDLTIAIGAGYNVASPSAASGTITNDDNSVSVTVLPLSVAEDGGMGMVYTFTRTDVNSGALVVNFTVGGTAMFTTDYTETGATSFTTTTGSVTFSGMSPTATLTLTPVADIMVEPDETAILTVTSGVGYGIGAPPAATGTITNDDTDVSVAVVPSSVLEDGVPNLVYTFTRSGVTTGALTANFSVGGTATFSTDYTQTGATAFSASAGTVDFGAGMSTATVTIDPTADSPIEADETVVLTVASGAGYGIGAPSLATGTITNDDADVSLVVSPLSVLEDGVPNLVYTFTRIGATTDALTINFTVGGTATFNMDYTQTGAATFTATTGTVTFAPGMSTAIVTLDPTTDLTVEPDKTAVLTIVSGTGYNIVAPMAATGTITNDDTDVTVAVLPSSVLEDGVPNLDYTFTRTGVTASSLTVNFSVGGSATFGMDYSQTGASMFTPPTGTVTFGAGMSTATVTLNPSVDLTVELDETAVLTVTSGAGYNVAAPSVATGTITNDDTDVTVAVLPSSVLEDGAPNLDYTFTRTGVTTGALTVNFSVGGLATFSTDYTQTGAAAFSASSGTVTFGVGMSTATVTLDPSVDATVEPDETAVLTVTSGVGYNVAAPSVATGTITNDDTDVTVTVAPGAVLEDDATNLVYTFTRVGVTTDVLVVNYSVMGTASHPGDYTESGSSLFLPPIASVTFGAGISTVNVTIDPVADIAIEPDETVIFSIAGSIDYNTGSPSTATGTITNDDNSVSVTVSPLSVLENSGTGLVYTFTRTDINSGPLVVNFTVGGTAEFATDYTQTGATTFNASTGSVTFSGVSPTATVTLDPTTDATVELDETAILTVTSGFGYGIGAPNVATGTIQNDDAAVITITSPSIVEGDGGSTNLVFTINLDNPSDANVVVNYTTVDGTAIQPGDYTLTAGTHTFLPSETSKMVSVPILGDCAIEPNEAFIVRLSGLVNNGRDVTLNGGGATLDGTGTITNDDAVPGIICPANISMNAAPGVCNATVTVTLPTISSLCGASTLEFRYRPVDAADVPTGPYNAYAPAASNSVNFTVGRYEVEWQITDGSGSSVCTFFLEVVDNQPPVAQCVPNFTLNLNGAGTGSITPADINNGSTDNCSIANLAVAPNSFTCANVGPVTVTLTVTDPANLTGTCTSTVNVIASAACTPPAIGNAGGPNISDPCTCLGNGRFAEEVVIGPSGPGQMWVVQSTTLINPNTNAPFVPGTPFTQVNIGGGQFIYVLQGVHMDGVGYSLTATSVYYPNITLAISNTCYYPDPVISGPEGTFCLNSADATFTGTAGPGIDGTGQFFLNGVPVPTVETPVNSNNWVTTLDFSTLGLGNYTLVFQFDAGNPAGLLAPPNVGCIASVSRFISVVATPSNLICNDLLTIGLDESCSLVLTPDMILEGTYFCYDDYVVEIDRTLPLGNGPWTPGMLSAADVHKTYAVRVRHLVSGNSCWGNISIEDKLPPVITCPCGPNNDNFCTYDCADLNGILDGTIATPLPVAIDGCEDQINTIVANPNVPGANLYKKDEYFPGLDACSVARIERTWTAKDSWGNSAQCTQIFYLEPFTHDDIDFPDDITIDCAGCGSAPGVRPCDLPAGHNVPYAGGYPLIANPQNINVVGCGTSGGLCNLGTSYTDIRIDICAGTFKILRHWIVLDWCTNETWTHDQLIKVVDDEGPVISCPADMTVSTNPSQCCATVDLPNVIVEDRCSPTASISAMIQVYEQYPTGPDGDDLDTDPDPLVIATYTLNKTTNPGQFKLETFLGNNFWDCDTLGNYGTTPCLPIGRHLVTYMAQDVCGNIESCTFWLTVVDDIPPVATCTEFTTVAIGTDDPTDCYAPSGDCKFGGVTWIPASAFNQGSYDNCNDIAFTVRRMKADTGYSDCIEDLKNAPGCDNWRVGACGELDYNDNNGFNDEYDIATAENDSIKFYCCEVGTTQRIILRVYQLDIYGHWAYYTDENGNALLDPETGCIQYIYNECMIDVEVQDKIKPLCQAPPHVTVSCENFEPSLWAYGYPSVSDNCCLDDTPPTSAAPGGVANIPAGTTAIPGVCGATQKTYYNGFLNAGFDTTCNRGIIIRRFTAWDCYGQSSSCTQRITVTSVPDYNIVFPPDDTENCVGVPDFGYPQITNDEGCELIGVAYNDVYFTVVPDACYKIERTWRVINWCDYDPDAACFEQLRANGRSVRVWNNPAIAGDETPNCVTYKQIIKVIDQTPPTITCTPIDTCDYSSNFDTDGLRYWNDGDLWWDNGTMSHNLCETDKTLMSVSAEDFCDSISPVGGLRFRYLLFLDLDADGIMETVVSSADAATRPFGRVRYNNYQNPNYGGGNLRRFDLGSNPYAFNIEQTLTGARVIWRTASGATQDPNLPHGRHKIKWIAEDGCGNEAVCEEFFTIRDCKAPTVACADVNINLMFGGMATLWTSDFFLYAEDNCTPADILKVAVIRQDDIDYDHTSFPAGSPQSIVVTCADQGTNVPVEVWVIDAAGRADFCTAYVNVQANLVGCNTPATATVAGALATENAQGVEDASVELAISSSGGQGVLTDQSDVTGSFQFPNAVPMSGDYTLTPTKDDNPLNGVTTYDLVLISKHILGLEPLTTPYKMIAADANRSGSITTFDIVEFRKLILGIYEELPTNTSWRFVDKTFPFPNPANPFQSTFPENISVQNVQSSQLAQDFVGVKVGDVNGTVTPNSLVSIDDRTAATMLFDIQDRAVKAGEVFTVNFKGAEKVQGYQFTMNFNGLEVMDILPGTDMKLDNFAVFGDAITTSVDGAANEFAVTFRAVKAGQISQMLGVSGRITKAEGYSLTNDRLDIAFRFNNGNTSTISGVGFELYQNQPNPFVNKTFIGFHLPEAANATLRIFDATGRMVFTQQGDFAKGYNTFAIDRQLLNTTGVLYYTVETTTDSATKKMIQSK